MEQAAREGAVDILLISPERLANERFRDQVLADVAERIALLVIDEATASPTGATTSAPTIA